jgi:drug/metabolite transporter (DMT)-like permease
LFAPPIALIYLYLLHTFSDQAIPDFSQAFLWVILLASVLQIAATSLMVVLFKQKNFAVGAGLAKSEALVAGVVGTLFFGSQLSLFGWLGIFVGAAAVFVLSGGGQKGELSFKTVLLGLACGTCFALTSLYVREAAHMLDVPFPHSAGWVLLWVLCTQTLLLIVYIGVKNPSTFLALKSQAKMTLATSLTSCLGSICWFSAMALHHVAYVKTLGQIEVLFTILIAVFWLKNPVKKHEIIGLLLIASAAVMVMWA